MTRIAAKYMNKHSPGPSKKIELFRRLQRSWFFEGGWGMVNQVVQIWKETLIGQRVTTPIQIMMLRNSLMVIRAHCFTYKAGDERWKGNI